MSADFEVLPLEPLTAICTLDGRYRKDVADLAPHASELGIIRRRFEVEGRYLVALSEIDTPIPLVRPLGDQEKDFLSSMGQNIDLQKAKRVKQIEDTTDHDVKAVELVFGELLQGTSMVDLVNNVHMLVTSEDINNLTYRLLVRGASDEVCVPAMDKLVDQICGMALANRDVAMLARTHGQPAVPTTLGKELAIFAHRLNAQARSIEGAQVTGKINGASGNYNSFESVRPDIDWVNFTRKFVSSFGFEPNLVSNQINPYDDLVKVFQEYQTANNILRGADQDMWRYISDRYFYQLKRQGSVGSSTMPQKINPIRFERSEGNLEVANGVLGVLVNELPVSRLQRDLSDSTVIRCFGIGFGFSLLGYRSAMEGFNRVKPNYTRISQDLNADWSNLGELVQQKMREDGIDNAYDLVKEALQGEVVDEATWKHWIKTGLPSTISTGTRTAIEALTPASYIGQAPELTDLALLEITESRKGSRTYQAV